MKNFLKKFGKLKTITQNYIGYIGYKVRKPKLFSCLFNITFRCNLNCSFCPFFGKGKWLHYFIKQVREMTTEEAKYAIDQVKKLGVNALEFSGGEALLRNDLEELARYAKKKNLITSLTTNGTLITEDRARSLRGCFDNINVSIHGLEKIDDETKGQKGAFKKSVNGLRLLKKYSEAKVGIAFTINKYNYHQIEDMLNFAKKNCDYILYNPINYFSEFYLDKDSAKWTGMVLLKLKEKEGKFIIYSKNFISLFPEHLEGKNIPVKCSAFDSTLSLSPAGDLGGCCYPFTVGNILKQNAKDLLKLGLSKKHKLQKKCGGKIIARCGQ